MCKHSILFRDRDADVTPLKSQEIPEWCRETESFQATDFTYTRFAVPYLMDFKGVSLFCDCDFIWLDPPSLMVSKYFDPKYAVMVVKHPMYAPNSVKKMDGKIQSPAWPRKNWASMIIWNNEHPKNRWLNPRSIADIWPGKPLHEFMWLKDEEIGSIPLEWNCLDDYYHLEYPRAIHFTDGGPWFKNYQNTMYSRYWMAEFRRYEMERNRKVLEDLDE